MILRTPRLLLRPAVLDDVDHWDRLNHAPGVMRHLASRAPSRQETAASLRRMVAAAALHHDYGFFSAFADEAFVGWFHLKPGLADDGGADIFNPELGYRLLPESWGQGLATEGSRALLDHAFPELGVSSVQALTMTVNTGSRRVMERLGMRLEGSEPWPHSDLVEGHEQGVVRYRITLPDWTQRHLDVRARLHQLQREALARRDDEALAALRRTGMELAGLEADGERAADSLVEELATRHGITLRGQ
ncbi:GNAT family N-acetyltransferase [Luteococcus peritonei]|uniref:GNAT family N-acetyltransferase n=1 Tax=Luteococcus peritonei TaxID=88874 RepID=A0ABW4RYK8_9ACTN